MGFKHEINENIQTIIVTKQCDACTGSGVYKGYAEQEGFAVQCRRCKGSGCSKETITWIDFNGRVTKPGIHTVVEFNPGIGLGGVPGEFNFGGMSYKSWSDGDPFPAKSEMREYTCPAQWYQSIDYDKKPKWDECLGCGMFSSCDMFSSKNKCWEKFDKEYQI